MNPTFAVLLGAAAVAVAFFLFATFLTARQLVRDHGRLRMVEAVRGQGRALPEAQDEAAMRAVASAARRCVGCTAHERCDALLAACEWRALRRICPNTSYIDSLHAR